jgi:hypothetical protein
MDPLSIAAGAIAILQVSAISGKSIHALLSLKDAPQQLQQLWNEAESLRGKFPESPSDDFDTIYTLTIGTRSFA